MKRFNPERELRKIQHGTRDKILYGVIALLLIISIGSTFALYQVRYSKRIIYTKVAPFSSKDIELAVKVEGEEGNRDDFPSKEETNQKGIKFTGIICDKDDVTTAATWDDSDWLLVLKTKGPNKCTVNFGKTHTVKTIVTSNGHVDIESQEVNPNEDSEIITITPDEGYGVESITCSNNQVIEQTENIFKVTKITSDTKCSIKISKKYVITAHVEGNGNVSPDKQLVIPHHDSEEFTVSPDDNYIIKTISCTNGQQVEQTVNIFKVTDVTSDSDCTVTIGEKKVFKVTINTDKGTVKPTEMDVTEGEDSGTFTLNYPEESTYDYACCYTKNYVNALNCSNGQTAVKEGENDWKIQNVTSDTTCSPIVERRQHCERPCDVLID